MGGYVLVVGLPDDFEGPEVGVGDVRDGVSVQGGLVGDGADLLHGDLRTGRSGKAGLEGGIVAEGDVRAGELAVRGVRLGAGEGRLRLGGRWSGTLGVLVQTGGKIPEREHQIVCKSMVVCQMARKHMPSILVQYTKMGAHMDLRGYLEVP